MFNLKGAVKTIKKQGKLIHQYQEEHEILIDEINKLKAENQVLKDDLYLAIKKKVEYRTQLLSIGKKVKSMLYKPKHA